MKLPNTFRPNKDLEENIKELMSKKNSRSSRLSQYIHTRDEFKEFCKDENDLWARYNKAEMLACGFKYNTQDLYSFAKLEYEPELGMYISALAEKFMVGDNSLMFIRLAKELDFLGFGHKRGTLVIEGNVRSNAGCFMEGGKLIIKGNTGLSPGTLMNGGEMIVRGNAGDQAGDRMSNGALILYGHTGKLAGQYMKGGNLAIQGNADGLVGYEMANGEITVALYAGDGTGFQMKDGKIFVNTTGEKTGWAMRGGELIVELEAGLSVGAYMTGGTIKLNGSYKSISDIINDGTIYHKGEKIWPKEQKLKSKSW
ncbi:MAG: hypothetical protein L6408_08285 [Nanoarchaeota archaeon]|nr:hypothetical protein [Nanoarchaeota archaeon]